MLESLSRGKRRQLRRAYLNPTNFLRGKRRSAACLNFRAARFAFSLPPYTLSLNILVTILSPRRKWTWKPCVCFFARVFVSMRRMFASESGLGRRLRMKRN